MIKIENKLYSSTEVADILGVSLRSVYRYLEENKLTAEVKTATGRHRFTRQNIIDFLYPTGVPEGEIALDQSSIPTQVRSQPKVSHVEEASKIVEKPEELVQPKFEVEEEKVIEETKLEEKIVEKDELKEESDEQVDWLAKFREAAKKFEESSEEVTGLGSEEKVEEEIVENAPSIFYYRSRLGGLKDIAQNIDKTSRNSGLDYAFTLNAGLSLYKPINPFSILHVYVRSKDKDFFERILALTPSDETNAQLCVISSDDDNIYSKVDDMHGLKVVEKNKLIEDISEMDESLMKEAQSILK